MCYRVRFLYHKIDHFFQVYYHSNILYLLVSLDFAVAFLVRVVLALVMVLIVAIFYCLAWSGNLSV